MNPEPEGSPAQPRVHSRRSILIGAGKLALGIGAAAAFPLIPLSDRGYLPIGDPTELSTGELVGRLEYAEKLQGSETFSLGEAKKRARALTELFARTGNILPTNFNGQELYDRIVFLPDFTKEGEPQKFQEDNDKAQSLLDPNLASSVNLDSFHVIQYIKRMYPGFYASLANPQDKIGFLSNVYLVEVPGYHDEKGHVILNLGTINKFGSFNPNYTEWQNIPQSQDFLCIPVTPSSYLRCVAFHELQHLDSFGREMPIRSLTPELLSAYSSEINDPIHIANRPQDQQTVLSITNGETHNFGITLHTTDTKINDINYSGMLEFVDDFLASSRCESLGLTYTRPNYDTELDFRNFQTLLTHIGISLRQFHDMYYRSDLEGFLSILGNFIVFRKSALGMPVKPPLQEAIQAFSPVGGNFFNWEPEDGLDWKPWKPFIPQIDDRPRAYATKPGNYPWWWPWPLEVNCLLPQ